MYTNQSYSPLFAAQYFTAASDNAWRALIPTPLVGAEITATRAAARRDSLPIDRVARTETSLESRIKRPDWARDEATYHAWRQSLQYPDVLFALPMRFKCHLCKCEKVRRRVDIGIVECAWCAGEGRDIRRR